MLVEVYATFADAHPALYQTLMTDMTDAEAAAVTLWGLLHGLWGLQRANLLGGEKPADVGRFGIDARLRGLADEPPASQNP